MSTIVSKERVNREDGYLYYLGRSGRVERVKRGGGKKEVVGTEVIVRKPMHLYFVTSKGEVGEAMMSHGKRHVEKKERMRAR